VRARRGDRLKPDDEPELMEGKFWTGSRSVALGLADGEGDLRRVMRERYGARTRFRYLHRRQGLARRLGFARSEGGGTWDGGPFAGWADGLLAAVEERALWSRFGL